MTMNKRQKIVVGAVIILLLGISSAAYLGGLVKKPEPESLEDADTYQGYPRTITDSAGRNVTIVMPIKRIITLTSDSAEGVRTLGEVDNIVGIVDTIKTGVDFGYFHELKDKPLVGTWREFDYEKIVEIAMNSKDFIIPDIIVISYVYKVSEVEEKLSPFGNITVVGLDLYKPSTLEGEIIKLGYILERGDAAQRFIDWRQEKEESVRSAVGGLERPKVYIELGISTGTRGLSTFGQGSALNELCEIAGGNNIAKNIEAKYPKVSWEWVISQNPDVIIKEEPKVYLGVTDKAREMREEVINRPGARNISAIKNGAVYILNRKLDYGLENVVGLTYWAQIFHPEVDLDPEAVYREYLEEFQGIEYPEDKMVVYPEIKS